jgi:transposase
MVTLLDRVDTAYPQTQAYYQRKRSEGKSRREAMRCLKRRLSDTIYRQLIHDAHNKQAGPGGHSGATLTSRAAG